ncbi:MAG: hypothetical protein ACRYFU_10685 [Janthinobacterium lividum]
MSPVLAFARQNGWGQLLGRASGGLQRRLRDGLVARQLGSPGFRVGRSPRLLGLDRMTIGPDFHAGDALWLEAVIQYAEGGAGAHYDPQLTIGCSTRLSDNVHIGCLHRVTIGDHLLCGSRVLISDHGHGRYRDADASDPAIPPAQRPLFSTAPVLIGNNVWLGDGVAVLAGAIIGDGCVIGANAVVTGLIPPGTLAVGAPARGVRQWNAEARTWLPLTMRNLPVSEPR